MTTRQLRDQIARPTINTKLHRSRRKHTVSRQMHMFRGCKKKAQQFVECFADDDDARFWLTNFASFPLAWFGAIRSSKDCSIRRTTNHSRHHSRPPPIKVSSDLQRRHATVVKSSVRWTTSCWSSDCRLRTRCESQRDFRHPQRRYTVSFLQAFAPKCAATRDCCAAPAGGDTSWPPATVLCRAGLREPAVQFQHSPWETLYSAMASGHLRWALRCVFCAQPDRVLSNLALPWRLWRREKSMEISKLLWSLMFEITFFLAADIELRVGYQILNLLSDKKVFFW